jgi:hypothetical protein
MAGPSPCRVLEGEVTFFVDGEVVPAVPGDVVVAPAGVSRTFRIESEEARWLVLTRVRSMQRFRDFGRAVSRPIAEPEAGWPSPDEEATVRGDRRGRTASSCSALPGPWRCGPRRRRAPAAARRRAGA